MTFSDVVAETHVKLIEAQIESIKDSISRHGHSLDSYRFEIGRINGLRRALELRAAAVKKVEES